MKVTDPKTIDLYYEALLARKQDFVGIFYVGVKTTSIFCIATCRARKPKKENVNFYTTVKEAVDHGFRPCKVCKPTQHAHESPEQIKAAIQLVEKSPKQKITDQQLRNEGISPEILRRWFKKHYGMTFQAYQRMYRMNVAFQELKKGKNVTHTAFDSGYESLSGFGYTFKRVIGQAPQNSAHHDLILISRLTTPLGPMFVCATNEGICLLEFVDRKMLETEFQELQKRLKSNIIAGENEHTRQLRKELTEYFEGKRKAFSVKLVTPGTDFQRKVWSSLQTIDYAETTTYQAQAEAMQQPGAVRAVAAANGHNRISIIIPCHRVVGKNGQLIGYGGGIERKRWLLEHEHKHK